MTAQQVREIADHADDFAKWAQELGPKATVVPALIPAAIALGPYVLAVIGVVGLVVVVVRFRDALFSPVELPAGDVVRLGHDLASFLRRNAREIERRSERNDPQTSSPTAILQHELNELRADTALLELWKRGHHSEVHVPLVGRENQRAAAEARMGVATATLAREAAEGFDVLYSDTLPRLRRNLRELVTEEAQARRRGDRLLAQELAQEATLLRQRINSTIAWVRDEVIPRIMRRLAEERAARERGDLELGHAVGVEESERTEADLQLQSQLALIFGNILPPVLHATQKVNKTEAVFDQMMRSDMNWAAMLLVPSAFVQLVTRLLVPVAMEFPSALAGLERAASRVLGVI